MQIKWLEDAIVGLHPLKHSISEDSSRAAREVAQVFSVQYIY